MGESADRSAAIAAVAARIDNVIKAMNKQVMRSLIDLIPFDHGRIECITYRFTQWVFVVKRGGTDASQARPRGLTGCITRL
jgi:hypothetical protein